MRGTFKEFGKEVRDILRGMIDQKLIKVDALESDKYGRILGVLYGWTTDNEVININQYLVDHAMAKAYDGGTKEAFTQADYDYFINNFRNTVWPTFVNYPNTLWWPFEIVKLPTIQNIYEVECIFFKPEINNHW